MSSHCRETVNERNDRRRRDFDPAMVILLEGLDRRRAAEARLQPLADLLEAV